MISVVIIAKNEEQNIEKCLNSVRWCDEIIIIDDNSIDRTIEIAKNYKVSIYKRILNNDFSAQRNFGLSKAKSEWVLFLDADEVVSDALTYEIQNAITLKDQNLRNYNGFYIKRADSIWGKQLKYGETGNIKFLRLGRRIMGNWKRKVHEEWDIKSPVGNLINPILHYPHSSLANFLTEINVYSDIRASELKDKNVKVILPTIILYPLAKFIINYLIKRGFMDGIRGIIFAIIMSFHSFLVRGKLWILNSKQ